MRLRHVMLLVLASSMTAACAYTKRFPFDTVANSESAATSPPGVRIAVFLDGVHELPAEGIAVMNYELRIELEQAPDAPQWRPALDEALLRDDEGNVVRLSAWYVDDSKSKPVGLNRYRCMFELKTPYRFEAIMGATVHWKLVSPGDPAFRIISKFQQ